ncbi:MAG: c-type cytochrome [Gammaproteobacteria bacterium]|nr:c-type cytochrome [Gammaproteobacteria bacterium]
MRLITLLALTMLTAPAQAEFNGEQLYARNCAACHGMDGKGGVGVPLALDDFLASVPDSYLFKTIRNGRPGRVMPAFTNLDDEQIRAIVGHIRSWGPPQPSLSGSPIKGNAGHGKLLFDKHCAACHGANGEGSPGTGVTFSRPRDLPILAPALNNPGFLKAAPDQMIKQTLMNGRKGTPMVSFLEMGLSESDINDIVSYVRSFENENGAATSIQLEAETPVLVYESSYDFATTVENVKKAAIGKNFRIIREQYLDQGMVEPGTENTGQKMVYFCNFQLINEALAIDPRVGLFMPCRVTVVEQDGVIKVMSINPKYLSPLFNNSYLNRACNEMYDIYEAILEEATL